MGRAVALSQLASHPIALAVTRMGKKLGITANSNIENFKLFPGAGVHGTIASPPNGVPHLLYFGSLDFVTKFLPEDLHEQMQKSIANAGGKNSVSILLEQSGQMNEWSVFYFEDKLRNNSADAVASLRTGSWKTGEPISSLEKNVVMLTGKKIASTLDRECMGNFSPTASL